MTPAKPQIASDLDDASTELDDRAEWTAVIATADYVGQQAEGMDFSEVIARGGRWSGVVLDRFVAANVRFENCDLSGFVLRDESSIQRAEFIGCRLSGSVLAGTRLRDVLFTDCTFDDANLRMMDAENVAFERCALLATDFYAAKLVRTRMADCDLRGSDFSKATVEDLDLRTSRVEDVLGAAGLRGATIESLQLIPLAASLAAALELRVVDD